MVRGQQEQAVKGTKARGRTGASLSWGLGWRSLVLLFVQRLHT